MLFDDHLFEWLALLRALIYDKKIFSHFSISVTHLEINNGFNLFMSILSTLMSLSIWYAICLFNYKYIKNDLLRGLILYKLQVCAYFAIPNCTFLCGINLITFSCGGLLYCREYVANLRYSFPIKWCMIADINVYYPNGKIIVCLMAPKV